MRTKNRSSIPDIVNGYELNSSRGYFSVIEPIERTNLILNPSFETNTTGYTAQGSAILTRTVETQRRGAFSLKVKPGLQSDSGVFYTSLALAAGAVYAFSLDVNIRGGRKYTISAFDGIRTVGVAKVIGKGYWERVSIVFQTLTAGAHRLFLQKDGVGEDTNEFFTDGWQLELCDTVTSTSVYNLTGSLFAHWKLEETLTATRVDSHRSNNLSPTNSPTAVLGKINFANRFIAASSQYLSISDNTDLSTGNINFDLMFWFNPDTIGAQDIISRWENGSNDREYNVDMGGAGTINFRVSSTGVAQDGVVTASNFGALSTGVWYLIEVWHDADNDIIGVSVNGVSNTAAYALGVFDAVAPFEIGRIRVQGYLNGRVDSVSFWKRLLSSDERSFLYNSGNGRDYPFTVDSVLNNGNGFPTTYIDGDQQGYVINQLAYYWTGTPHASTSVRSGQTRSGGKMTNLLDYGFRLLSVIGLGMAPILNTATPFGLIGGANYQRTTTRVRQFTLVGSVNGSNLSQTQRNIRYLEDSLKPDLTGDQQPLLLRYQYSNDSGDPIGEIVDIVCNYNSGLEGNLDNLNQEKIGLQFVMFDPYVTDDGERAATLSYAQNISNANKIIRLAANGQWSALGTGYPALGNAIAVAVSPDGSVFVGTTAGSNNLYRFYNGTWTLIATASGTGSVNALAISADGLSLYAGGSFTSLNGVAAGGLASINLQSFAITSLSSGITGPGGVFGIAIAPDGTLYVSGQFSVISGLTVDGIARRSPGGVWSKLTSGSGITNTTTAYDVRFGPDGLLYLVGNFSDIDGVTRNGVAKYNTSTSTWASLSTGISGGGATVYSIAFGKNGLIYIGGSFTSAGGISANNIAQYNGTAFSALGSGLTGGTAAAIVSRLVVTATGKLYAIGGYTTAGGSIVPASISYWTGSAWIPLGVNLPGNESLVGIAIDSNTQDIYFGYSTSGTASASANNSVTNYGRSKVNPRFIIDGPGVLRQIVNNTNGRGLFFNDLTLLNGEQLSIITAAGKISITSSFRGNMISYLSPASDIAGFSLQPGSNSVSAFLETAGANTLIRMIWRQTSWGILCSVR